MNDLTQPFKRLPVALIGTGSYVPERRLTNSDLEKMVDTSNEWIVERTGIEERRIAAPDEKTSDMATNAARKAIENAGIKPEEIDLIIVATITPDTFTPSTACYVQANLGAVNAAAFDISAACSGFLYALKTAVQYIGCGQARTALIIASEKLSHIVNWEDRSTCVLFGDGAGAAVLRTGTGIEGDSAILASDIGTDGSLTDILLVPGGGSAIPTTEENIHEKLYTVAMRGNELFRHAVQHMKDSALSLIKRTGINPEDIALVVPHQANLRIINAVTARLGIAPEKVFVNLQKYGNTSGAACIIALDEALRAGRAKKGDIVLMVTFGAGLTWSSAAIRI
ncbi:MAG TPA: ketoacyl-ACP synthase III [Candidatus Akkermansia intestinigallinarum]|uniref:Beta-ketoacyl-[acyl-carrier-protein] synthase III n=1 Tax=Candidatus Akkermansia intestinigallinarum TaxID=2838431 RepID=A0A9D1VD84_9BACT|nr:ketoacyl-ACP synthase III [Candidatus Akkermansia intestinigallinarum]